MNKWFTVKKLTKFVWGIGEFGHFEKVISYLIVGKRAALLFDTGIGSHNIKEVVRKITTKDMMIINSHNHYDHTGGNKFFDKKTFVSKKTIKIAPLCFRVIPTPGHTPQSICLYEKKAGYLFTGDTIYDGPIYLHLKESSVYDYIKSLRKIIRLKNIRKIFPGHNGYFINKKSVKNVLGKLIQELKLKSHLKKITINDRLIVLLK